jgi:hypothetical protein
MTDTIESTKPTKRPRRMAREQKCEASGSPAITATFEAAKPTKASLVEGLLLRIEGAALDDLCGATGWLPHTCRAFLTGLRKKGREVERSKREDGSTIYHLAPIQKVA